MTRILTMNNKFHNVIKHHELKLIAVLCKAYTSRGVVELFAELAVIQLFMRRQRQQDYTHRRLGCRPFNGA